MNRRKNLRLNPLAKKAQKRRAKLAGRTRNAKRSAKKLK